MLKKPSTSIPQTATSVLSPSNRPDRGNPTDRVFGTAFPAREIDRHHHNRQRQFPPFARIPKLALERYRLVPILQYQNNREPRLHRVEAGFSARLARAVPPHFQQLPAQLPQWLTVWNGG